MNFRPPFPGFLLLAGLVAWLSACSGEPQTGPGKVRWDREICARCAMALRLSPPHLPSASTT